MERAGRILVLLTLLFSSGGRAVDAASLDEVLRSRHNLAIPSLPPNSACTICHTDTIPGQTAVSKEQGPPPEAALPKKATNPPRWSGHQEKPYLLTATLSPRHHPYNQPSGSSLTCVACHDGALATDMHGINVDTPQLGAPATKPWTKGVTRRGAPPLSRVDHPISILYPRKPDGRFVPENPSVTYARYWTLPDLRPEGYLLPENNASSYLDLPSVKVSSPELLSNLVRTTSGRVECDSCHNPHSEKIRPFLRVPSQTLCLVCHDR
ncbi:MAG: cytochrome c3 family protein [Candidatus Manganitrophaceae bacterium]